MLGSPRRFGKISRKALKRLTDTGRSGMGSMFKVLGISEPRLTGIAGLSDLERAGGTS